MHGVKVTPKRANLISVSLSSDFHIGLKIHYCSECGGFVGIYLTFLHIEIPIVRKIVDNAEMVKLTPEQEKEAFEMLKKYVQDKEKDKPPA